MSMLHCNNIIKRKLNVNDFSFLGVNAHCLFPCHMPRGLLSVVTSLPCCGLYLVLHLCFGCETDCFSTDPFNDNVRSCQSSGEESLPTAT